MKIRLSSLRKAILKTLDAEGAVSTKMLTAKLKKPPVTISRNLASLVRAGMIQSHGRAAGVYYTRAIGATLAEITKLKAELERHRPLPEPIVENIQKNLEAKFIYSTRTIEGAKLPLRETALILSGISIKGNRDEIKNVRSQKMALDLVHEFVHAKKPVAEKFIIELQRVVTSDVVDVFLHGRYRDHEAGIARSTKTFPSPSEVKKLMPEFIATLNRLEKKHEHPALIAAYAHYKLLAIHPFQDGNGRTARLLMNVILLRHHFPIAIIEASLRQKYYEVLRHADEGAYEIFEAFIFDAIKKSLTLYLDSVRV